MPHDSTSWSYYVKLGWSVCRVGLLFAESLFTEPISSQWPQCFEIGSCIGRLATFVTFLTRQPASLTWAECWCQEVARQEVV